MQQEKSSVHFNARLPHLEASDKQQLKGRVLRPQTVPTGPNQKGVVPRKSPEKDIQPPASKPRYPDRYSGTKNNQSTPCKVISSTKSAGDDPLIKKIVKALIKILIIDLG